MTPIKSQAATLVLMRTVVATEVAFLAREHVAFDNTRRKLLMPGDADYPSAAQISSWHLPAETAAVVLTPNGSLSTVLDVERARSEARIEDAFVRALSDHDF